MNIKCNQIIFLAGSVAALISATMLKGSVAKVPVQAKSKLDESISLFENKIRPILAERCFSCHGVKDPKGRLVLENRDGFLKGGKNGPVVVPGEPDHSNLIRAITYMDAALKMPPDNRLNPSDIAILTEWVRLGAKWPDVVLNKTTADSKFWAYVPPRKPVLPSVRLNSWIKDPMDRFILNGLEARMLTPAPPADRRTLIRRATFDLTGLPPAPAEVKDFLADNRSDAYPRLIDRLLASPAYGEKWGRHWLDTARYADSNGVDENLVFAEAWRYRDYVVRAFNQDKPIDRFFHEQIAGDLMVPEAPDNFDNIIATGYLSLGPKMLAEDDPVKQEMDIIDEQIDTLTKTFLGVTIGCARCHDHKFDPFPTTDYYALAGIFKSTRTMMNFKNMAEWQEVSLAPKEISDRRSALDAEVKKRAKKIEGLRSKAGNVLLEQVKLKTVDYVRIAAELNSNRTSSHALTAVIGSPNGTAPANSSLIEAEDFVRGNLLKDTGGFGKGIGVLVNAGTYPNQTEYEFDTPEEAPYQIDLRYASGDFRPIRIYINGILVISDAASKVTGGFYPQHQAWFAEGVFLLKTGRNVIKFERDSYFPHIDKVLLTSRKGMLYPKKPEQLAAESGLIPEFVTMVADQLRNSKDLTASAASVQFEVPNNPDHLFPPTVQAEIKSLTDEKDKLNKEMPVLPKTMAVSEGKPVSIRVHMRGSYLTLGDECQRRFPAVLSGSYHEQIPDKSSGRLELAKWMTNPNHALTSRVFVNRVWRWHFGKGIVGSVDNFGLLGDRPTNQPLLDHLATTFVADNWSLKRLNRRIMLSSTYQMSAKVSLHALKVDPENNLHWRFDRRRLEAEEIRDSMLAVSGLLDKALGGTLLKFKDRQYVTSTANSDPVDYRSNRRSLYLPIVRSALFDVYTAFDFGDPTVMNGDRPTTTVAPQALFMMNSAFALEQTKMLAQHLLKDQTMTDSARIEEIYETCFARPASQIEIARAKLALTTLRDAFGSSEKDADKILQKAWQSLCKAIISSNEFIYIN